MICDDVTKKACGRDHAWHYKGKHAEAVLVRGGKRAYLNVYAPGDTKPLTIEGPALARLADAILRERRRGSR